MGFTNLYPPPQALSLGARSRNHASHSRETTRTTLGALCHAVSRRSSTAMRVSAYTARSAFLIVVGLTRDASRSTAPLGPIQDL